MCAIRPTSAHRAGDTPPILLQRCKFYCSCNRGFREANPGAPVPGQAVPVVVRENV